MLITAFLTAFNHLIEHKITYIKFFCIIHRSFLQRPVRENAAFKNHNFTFSIISLYGSCTLNVNNDILCKHNTFIKKKTKEKKIRGSAVLKIL
jgi:hypothetical protein